MPEVDVTVGVQEGSATYRRLRDDLAELRVTQEEPGFEVSLDGRDAGPALDALCEIEVRRHLDAFLRLHRLLLERVDDGGTRVRPEMREAHALRRSHVARRDGFVVGQSLQETRIRITVHADAGDAEAVHALFYALGEARRRVLEAWYRARKEEIVLLRGVN